MTTGDTGAVRVGLAGLGNSGRHYHLPLLLADPRVELRAVAAASRPSLDDLHVPAGVERVRGWEAVTQRDDLDLVVLALPHHLHHPAAAALDAGRHVLVDKPMTVTTAEADDLIARAEKHGRVLAVFHQRRWEEDISALLEIIRSGEIGEPWRVVLTRGHQGHYATHAPHAPHVGDGVVDWVRERAAGGGVARLIGPHPVDHLLALVGQPVATVAGRSHQEPGEDVEDWLAVDVAFANGAQGHVEIFRHAGTGLPRASVWGTDGMAVAPDGTRVEVVRRDGRRRVVEGLVPPGRLGQEIYDDVLEAVRSGRPLRVPPTRARDVVEIVQLAEESAARGGLPLRPARRA